MDIHYLYETQITIDQMSGFDAKMREPKEKNIPSLRHIKVITEYLDTRQK